MAIAHFWTHPTKSHCSLPVLSFSKYRGCSENGKGSPAIAAFVFFLDRRSRSHSFFALHDTGYSVWMPIAGKGSLSGAGGHVVLLIAKANQRICKRTPCGGWGWLYRKLEFAQLLHEFIEQFTLDNSKPLWEIKTKTTTPLLLAATNLVALADSTIIESDALLELKKQLPNVNPLALRGALAAACSEAGYVKSTINQRYSAWVKGI